MIFLDQPARAGYSYGITVDNTPDAMKDTYEFLIRFFETHPEFIERDFHIAGTSYAGKYLPELAMLILEKNKSDSESNLKIPLKSIIIGNGANDPVNQYRSLPLFANLNNYGHHLESEELRELSRESETCVNGINECQKKLKKGKKSAKSCCSQFAKFCYTKC